jgi:hypothetical protein
LLVSAVLFILVQPSVALQLNASCASLALTLFRCADPSPTSGRYHAPAEPEDAAHASLRQLQAAAASQAEAPAQQQQHDGGLKAGQDNASAAEFVMFSELASSAAAAAAGDGGGADSAPQLSEDDLAYLVRCVLACLELHGAVQH